MSATKLTIEQLKSLLAARPTSGRNTTVTIERNANLDNVVENGAMLDVSSESKSDGTVKSPGSILQGYRKLVKSRNIGDTVTVERIGDTVIVYRTADAA